MPMTVSELQVKVSADTSAAESGLSSLGGKLGSMGGIATAAGAAVAGLGVALAAGVAVGVKAAGDLEQAVANISTIKPEIDTSQVSGALLDMSTRVAQSSDQLGESLYNVFSSIEVSQGDALALTEKFAQGAVAAQTDAQTFGTSVIGVMNAYGLSVADADHISDVFFNTVNKGVVTGQELATSLGPVTQSAKSAGVGINELGAMLAAVTKEGGPAAQNINNLNNFLQKVTTTEAQNQLNALGVATKTATGEFRPTTDVLTDLKERLGGMTEAARANALQAIFPDAQARIGAQVLISQLDLVKSVTEENTTATGVASAAYEKMAATFNSQSKILGNSLMAIGTTIGMELLPSITPLVKTISQELPDAFRTVRQAAAGGWLPSDEIPPFVNAVGKATLALTDLAGKIATLLGIEISDYANKWEALGAGISYQAGEASAKLRELGDAGQTAAQKLAEMGVAEAFGKALETAAREAGNLNTELTELKGSLTGLHGALGGVEGEATALGVAFKGVAAVFDILVLISGETTDTMLTMGRVLVDLGTEVISFGKMIAALATGDMPAATKAFEEGKAAAGDMVTAVEEWGARTSSRASQAMSDVTSVVTSGMGTVKSETQAGMAGAAAAIDDGSLAMQASMQSGMTGVVGAVESQSPAAVAAAEGMGTGMAAGIESAAPQMEAAAAQGASGAVAAVEGQAGPASAAGSSVGSSIGSGMLSGIQSWVGSIASAAAGLVSSAIAAARGEADAHSPSKKTEQLGKDLAQGLEVGLNSSNLGAEVQAKIRDFIAASREYIPVAGQIAQVESRIKEIREQSQTDALFRAEKMITLDSEVLRLKADMVNKERELLPLTQDIARASREIEDAERGLLTARQFNLAVAGNVAQNNIYLNQLEKEKIPLQQRSLAIERELLGITKDTEPAKRLQIEQEEIRKKLGLIDNTISQQRLLTRAQELDAASNREAGTVAATAGRIRKEALDDASRAQQRLTDDVKTQIATLDAERAVFAANEAIIKNATDNEIAYRNRLIAVFTAEGKPLADRIAAGRALLEQLHNEGKISDELYNAVKKATDQERLATGSTQGLGSAAAAATPQIGAAASQADRMAQGALAMAEAQRQAATQTNALGQALGRLPSWFAPTGGGGNQGLFHFAEGGRPPVGLPSIVGERGRELFVPDRPGTILPADITRSWMGGGGGGGPSEQTLRVRLEWPDGKQAGQIIVRGWDNARDGGWTPGGLTG